MKPTKTSYHTSALLLHFSMVRFHSLLVTESEDKKKTILFRNYVFRKTQNDQMAYFLLTNTALFAEGEMVPLTLIGKKREIRLY